MRSSGCPRAVDIGTQLPHAAVRAYVMGERAHDPATEDDLDGDAGPPARRARARARSGSRPAAPAGHRDIRGAPVPGTFAAGQEVDTLLGVMAAEQRGVLQLVPAGSSGEIGGDPPGAMDDELDWLLRSAVGASRPVTFLVLQSLREPDGWRPWFELAREANHRGADVHPQVASRCFGMLMGHQSRLNPFRYRASYREIADLPFEQRDRPAARSKAAGPDPRRRARVRRPAPGGPAAARERSSTSSRSATRSSTSPNPVRASPRWPIGPVGTRGP